MPCWPFPMAGEERRQACAWEPGPHEEQGALPFPTGKGWRLPAAQPKEVPSSPAALWEP